MIEGALGRLGGLKGGLLRPADWDALIASGGEAPARGIISRTCYAAAVERAGDGPPEALERELWREAVGAWLKLATFLEDAPLACFRRLAGSLDVENVRRAVRRVVARIGPGGGAPLWEGRGISEVDASALARAVVLEDVKAALAATPYAEVYELASIRLTGGHSLFGFEETLQAGYLGLLLGSARAVKGADGREARAYVFERVHFDNVRRAARLRFGRGLPAGEAKLYLAPAPGGARRRELERVLSAADLAGAAGALARLAGETPVEGVADLDRALRRARAQWSKRMLRAGFSRFSSVLAYLDVRSQEVRDLVAVLAALRQGRADRVRRYLGLAA